jgi:uncharacterized integral membrane protein (TIGR00697 family)
MSPSLPWRFIDCGDPRGLAKGCGAIKLGSLRVTTVYATQPREAPSTASFATAPSGTYAVIVAVFCGLLLISNIAATKTITVVDGLPEFVGGGIFTDGGAFLFPLTYIVGDILAEVYGLRQARRAIWVGFGLGALASLTFLAVGAAPPGPGYENQEAFVAVLGFVPRIVLASLSGYLAGQFLNAYVVVKIKERTKERHLWARLIGSTVVGEFADTIVVLLHCLRRSIPDLGRTDQLRRCRLHLQGASRGDHAAGDLRRD